MAARTWVIAAAAGLFAVQACVSAAAQHRSRRAVEAIVPAGLGEVRRLRVVDSSGTRTRAPASPTGL